MLLVWNIILTYGLLNSRKIEQNGNDPSSPEVEESTLTDITTDLTEAIDNTRSSVVTVISVIADSQLVSSGVIYAKDGSDVYIVTSDNLLQQYAHVTVRFDSGAEAEAEIVGVDNVTGIGILKVTPEFEVTPLKQGDSSLLEPGEYVIAMGGRRLSSGSSMVSFGIVSEPGRRRISMSNLWSSSILETDAHVSSDNLGGALLDLSGRLVGILINRPLGGQEKMGYALAMNEVKIVCQQLMEKGTVTRGSLAITGRNVKDLLPYERASRGLPLDLLEGVLVLSAETSTKYENPLQEGDVIRTIGDETVTDTQDLLNKLYAHEPQEEVTITILRDGSEITVQAVLQ